MTEGGRHAVPPPIARRDIVALTALRGAAAWWVVLYHVNELVPLTVPGRELLLHGSYAVDLFFVLSGFVIGLAYGQTFGSGVRAREYARFIGIRFARVYPLHLLTLALTITVPIAFAATGRPVDQFRFSFEGFVQSFFLLQNWGFQPRFVWNVPSWSISTELGFYLAFPVLVGALMRLGRGSAQLAIVGVALVGAIYLMGEATGGLTANTPRWGLVRCLSECMLGCWVWLSASRWAVTARGSVGLSAMAATLAGACALGAPAHATLPASFALLTWALALPGGVGRALEWRVLIWLGEVSFATYLCHYVIRDWVRMGLLGRVPDLVLLGLYIGFVLLASAALHAWVERPGRNWGRALVNRWTAPRGVAVTMDRGA